MIGRHEGVSDQQSLTVVGLGGKQPEGHAVLLVKYRTRAVAQPSCRNTHKWGSDAGAEQTKPGHPEVLSFSGAVVDFALAATWQCVFRA